MADILRRYRNNRDFRVRTASSLSFSITVVYSLLKAAAGLYLSSAYLGAMALYQLTLGGIRLYLLLKSRQVKHMDRREERTVGLGLIALTLALIPAYYHAAARGEAPRYPGFLIYGAAAFSFYNLTIAIVNLCRAGRTDRSVYSAERVLSLSSALASIFFLETALLAEFGEEEPFSTAMIAATGATMLLTILTMGISMIVRKRSGYKNHRSAA